MKATKLFLFTLLTGLTIALFSCRREDPEPSGNRDLIPCDTCDTVTPCSIDTAYIKNRLWAQNDGDGSINRVFKFTDEPSGAINRKMHYTTIGNYNLPNISDYTFIGCDSMELGAPFGGTYWITFQDSMSLNLICNTCPANTSSVYLIYCPDPASGTCE
jgi:hypothetical protein